MTEEQPEPPRLPIAPVVWLIVGAIAATYLAFLTLPSPDQEALIYEFALIPARFDPSSPFHFTRWYDYPAPIFGHIFLHAAWWHAAGNAFFFFLFARLPALRLGFTRFLILFFVSGVASAAAYVLIEWGKEQPAVGASGAVCGVVSAYFLSVRATWREALSVPAVRSQFGMMVFLNVVLMGVLNGFGAAIAWQAHLGGFIGGALAYVVLERPLPRGPWG